MNPVLLVLAIGILWWGFITVAGQDRATRRRWADIALGAAALVVLLFLLRIGLPWLALAGTALWAIVRYVAPIVLPILLPHLLRQRHSSESSNRASSPRDAPSNAGDDRRRSATTLSRREAFEILGLAEGASDDEIQRAYRDLIKKVHPDAGGSAHLASQVNRARDVLTDRK